MEFLKRLVIVLGCSLFVGLIGLCLALEAKNNTTYDVYVWAIVLLIDVLLTGLLVVICVVSVTHSRRKNEINEILSMQLHHNETAYEKANEIYEKARTLNHDLKAYMVSVLGYMENGDYNQAYQKLVDVTHAELTTEMVYFRTSREINAVLNEKLARANKEAVVLDLRIGGSVGESQKMKVAVMLSNLLDNAIEAEKNLQEKKIILEMFERKGMYCINVMNRIEQSVLGNNPELHTTKSDTRMHGFGVKSVKRMVRELDGTIVAEESDGMFCVHIVFPLCKS